MNYVIIILTIVALPSSIIGINDFTSFLTPELLEDFRCETGAREGWYKNCEYKFQFELDTDYWYIYDKNTKNIFSQPFEEEPEGYWITFDYRFTENIIGFDAYGSILIHDLSASKLTFDEYIVDYTNTIHTPTQSVTHEISSWSSDSNKLHIDFESTYFNFNESFSCFDSHILREQLVYQITTCEDTKSPNADNIRNHIANFWQTFLFY